MVYALVDCNSFYCSCERVFDPALAHVPVIVMSNNDGCAIARTDEVKALGVPMGAPIFKWRDTIRRHGIVLRSANFVLYGDMSRRVNDVLARFSPAVEVYSIDESFMDLSGFDRLDLHAYARGIRADIRLWTGLPTCIGIGPTRTLAKLANALAKKNPLFDGVCSLMDKSVRDRLLPLFPVADVWGIGRALRDKLTDMGVTTAADLRDMPAARARKAGTVVLERLAAELGGTPCAGLEIAPPPKKGVTVSRSFSRPVRTLTEMMESIAQHTARCGEKLRREGLAAGVITVFMHTSKHRCERTGEKQDYATRSMRLHPSTDDTRTLMNAARRLCAAAFKDGVSYAKSGVLLGDLRNAADVTPDLFAPQRNGGKALMQALDEINSRYGHMALFPASQGVERGWSMRQAHLSPRYTTRISDVPVVRAD